MRLHSTVKRKTEIKFLIFFVLRRKIDNLLVQLQQILFETVN